MAISSISAAHAMAGRKVCAMDDAAGSMIHAADKYSRGLGARTTGAGEARIHRPQLPAARGEFRRSAGRELLPEGYLPIRKVKDMTLLGWWPPLEDRMSACLPTKTIAAMQRRSALGDQEAETWLKMHARACAGEPEAQRAFGRVCENGSYRVEADLQRAFFWYYRAGLQGDMEALRNAERLMQRSPRIAAATMADPALIYPGQWRITAHLSEQLCSASVFDLASDGSATGSLLGNPRDTDTAGISPAVMGVDDDPAGDGPALSPLTSAGYRGGWAYDGIGQILTIIFESEVGERRWRSATWQIEMLGCKPGSIFGRDRRLVGYTIERMPGTGDAGPR